LFNESSFKSNVTTLNGVLLDLPRGDYETPIENREQVLRSNFN